MYGGWACDPGYGCCWSSFLPVRASVGGLAFMGRVGTSAVWGLSVAFALDANLKTKKKEF